MLDSNSPVGADGVGGRDVVDRVVHKHSLVSWVGNVLNKIHLECRTTQTLNRSDLP